MTKDFDTSEKPVNGELQRKQVIMYNMKYQQVHN